MRIRQLNHSVYQIQYHIVWGTKYRRKYIKPYVKQELVGFLLGLTKKFPDWYFHKINAGEDHVHLLMEIPPKYSIAEVVQKMKAYASVYLRSRFRFIEKIYDDGSIWSVGYFVSTVGLNEEQIKNYISLQDKFDFGFDVSGEFS